MADQAKPKKNRGPVKVQPGSKKRKRDYVTPKSFDPFARNVDVWDPLSKRNGGWR